MSKLTKRPVAIDNRGRAGGIIADAKIPKQ
jgi:hypothetical protein